jgi:hypothetical protein
VKKQQLLSTEADLVQLRTWIENGQYVAIECTGFAWTQSFKNSSEPEAKKRNTKGYLYFEKAIEAGKEQLNSQTRNFKYAIDLAVALYDWKIEPIVPPPPNTSHSRINDLLAQRRQKREEEKGQRAQNLTKESQQKKIDSAILVNYDLDTLEYELKTNLGYEGTFAFFINADNRDYTILRNYVIERILLILKKKHQRSDPRTIHIGLSEAYGTLTEPIEKYLRVSNVIKNDLKDLFEDNSYAR